MDKGDSFLLGFAIGIMVIMILLGAFGVLFGIHISYETANDVCSEITGEESIAIKDSRGTEWNNKLICKVIKEESKTNIIIKKD